MTTALYDPQLYLYDKWSPKFKGVLDRAFDTFFYACSEGCAAWKEEKGKETILGIYSEVEAEWVKEHFADKIQYVFYFEGNAPNINHSFPLSALNEGEVRDGKPCGSSLGPRQTTGDHTTVPHGPGTMMGFLLGEVKPGEDGGNYFYTHVVCSPFGLGRDLLYWAEHFCRTYRSDITHMALRAADDTRGEVVGGRVKDLVVFYCRMGYRRQAHPAKSGTDPDLCAQDRHKEIMKTPEFREKYKKAGEEGKGDVDDEAIERAEAACMADCGTPCGMGFWMAKPLRKESESYMAFLRGFASSKGACEGDLLHLLQDLKVKGDRIHLHDPYLAFGARDSMKADIAKANPEVAASPHEATVRSLYNFLAYLVSRNHREDTPDLYIGIGAGDTGAQTEDDFWCGDLLDSVSPRPSLSIIVQPVSSFRIPDKCKTSHPNVDFQVEAFPFPSHVLDTGKATIKDFEGFSGVKIPQINKWNYITNWFYRHLFRVLNDWRGADGVKRDVIIASFLLFKEKASKWCLPGGSEDPFGPIRHSFFEKAKKICSTGEDQNILIFGAPSFARRKRGIEDFDFDGKVAPEEE